MVGAPILQPEAVDAEAQAVAANAGDGAAPRGLDSNPAPRKRARRTAPRRPPKSKFLVMSCC